MAAADCRTDRYWDTVDTAAVGDTVGPDIVGPGTVGRDIVGRRHHWGSNCTDSFGSGAGDRHWDRGSVAPVPGYSWDYSLWAPDSRRACCRAMDLGGHLE